MRLIALPVFLFSITKQRPLSALLAASKELRRLRNRPWLDSDTTRWTSLAVQLTVPTAEPTVELHQLSPLPNSQDKGTPWFHTVLCLSEKGIGIYMSRTITQGAFSTYVENADTVKITHNHRGTEKAKLPETLTNEHWTEFVAFLTQFSHSKEAETLNVVNYKKVQEEVTAAKNSGSKSGWQRLRDFLGDTANATTILTPIVAFVAANSNQIAQWIQELF